MAVANVSRDCGTTSKSTSWRMAGGSSIVAEGQAGEPRCRRGASGRCHGHVVRRPGARRGVARRQRRRPRRPTCTPCPMTSTKRLPGSSSRRWAPASTRSQKSRSATWHRGKRERRERRKTQDARRKTQDARRKTQEGRYARLARRKTQDALASVVTRDLRLATDFLSPPADTVDRMFCLACTMLRATTPVCLRCELAIAGRPRGDDPRRRQHRSLPPTPTTAPHDASSMP